MIETLLKSDETLQQQWQPVFRVFLRKLFALALVTAVLLAAVSFAFNTLMWMLALPLFLAAFALDDYREWRQRRHDRWMLTNHRLIFINADDSAEPVSVDLNQINRVRKWLWWSVQVKLSSGQTISLLFLPQRDEIVAALQSSGAVDA